MPNGYFEAMGVFTKLLKVPFSLVRRKGQLSVVFVDDTYLQGLTFEQCLYNVQETITILQTLGFTIHSQKSFLMPTETFEFLWFVIDSRKWSHYQIIKKQNFVISYMLLRYALEGQSEI